MTRTTRKGMESETQSLSVAIREWLKSAAFGLIIFLVVRTLFVQTFTIVSGSMENTLLIGDFLVLNKAAYGATIPGTSFRLPGYDEPRRGDVVVFEGTEEPIDIVKRLVGMSGDTIGMESGSLHVNGRMLTEPYVRQSSSDDNWGPVLVPSGHYFVLGDNRDNSRDSRYWGFVPYSHLKGRAELLYFSWNRGGDGSGAGGSRVRWHRIGDLIR